jgi:hypothetical protein
MTQRSPYSSLLRFLGVFGLGCLLHVVAFIFSGQLARAVMEWHRAYDEITGFVVLVLWPVYIGVATLYGVLAWRVRPSIVLPVATALGVAHGVGLALGVYIENKPEQITRMLQPEDVVLSVDAACADQPLSDDAELRRIIEGDRNLTPRLSEIRGTHAVLHDLNGDSNAEMLIPLRCEPLKDCFWVLVTTEPTHQLAVFYGATLFIGPTAGSWPDIVGYSLDRAALLIYQSDSGGYGGPSEMGVMDPVTERFLASAPKPACGREESRL